MSPVQRILREPNVLTGAVTAIIGAAVVFGLPVTDEQSGALLMLVGAVVALLRVLVTPTSEVVVQDTPDGPVAGPASPIPDGAPVTVSEGD